MTGSGAVLEVAPLVGGLASEAKGFLDGSVLAA